MNALEIVKVEEVPLKRNLFRWVAKKKKKFKRVEIGNPIEERAYFLARIKRFNPFIVLNIFKFEIVRLQGPGLRPLRQHEWEKREFSQW